MSKIIFVLFLFLTIVIKAQFGSAPSGETWTPYVENYSATRWTDWSNAGRLFSDI